MKSKAVLQSQDRYEEAVKFVNLKAVYTKEQALKTALEFFDGDTAAADVFINKYALRDKQNQYYELIPDHMHLRLAREFARIEAKYSNPMSEIEIFESMLDFSKIIPQGSPMFGVGNLFNFVSLSNCYVLRTPDDSYGSIMYTDQQAAHIYRRRGGAGLDLSNIRPRGLPTNNAALTTDGISVFMQRYSSTTLEVAQQGRRGALMLTLSCHCYELDTFINIKNDKTKVTGANISIRLSDEFMKAVENDDYYTQQFPIESKNPIVKRQVKAKDVWKQIIKSAHKSAEPGLLNWDTIIKYSPADIYSEEGFKTVSTNPCSELPLCELDSCRLLSINLLGFVNNPFTSSASFNYDLFAEYVQKAQRLMDDLVDLEIECLDRIIAKIESDPEAQHVKQIELDLWNGIKIKCINGRRTGLGITALGDLIAELNVRYGSKESVDITDKIYKTLAINAYKSSCIMAGERGTFPIYNYNKEVGHPYLERLFAEDPELYDIYRRNGKRNISILTTAPAGSLSMCSRTTSGIEPVFLVEYQRSRKLNSEELKTTKPDRVDALGIPWKNYIVYHPGFQKWKDITGETEYEKSPYYKATSNDVDWASHVDIVAAGQKWVDHSISKTVNVPENATEDLISTIYTQAWKKGCKGITVYRDKCRDGVLNSIDKKVEKEDVVEKRPVSIDHDIHDVKYKNQRYYVLVGIINDKPYELFFSSKENLDIPSNIKNGKVIKNKKQYDLVYTHQDQEWVVSDIVGSANNPEFGTQDLYHYH
jgi:ribonucleoside-diphosphate reductase alpha chain